jgi:hypothetical protein
VLVVPEAILRTTVDNVRICLENSDAAAEERMSHQAGYPIDDGTI